VTALDTFDPDGDGVSMIVYGTDTGAIRVMNPADGSTLQTVGTFGSAINGLQVGRFAGGPDWDVIFCTGNRLHIRTMICRAVRRRGPVQRSLLTQEQMTAFWLVTSIGMERSRLLSISALRA
jgi:hypothetical protein